MTPLKHITLDCTTASEMLRGKAQVTEIEDLTGEVPHVGYGGAAKSSYVSPTSGKTIYVLERNGMYAPDAYTNDVWLFDEDFSAAAARDFLTAIDQQV